MKIAFVYGPFSIGQRPIDFGALESSPRGLTGSELSCIRVAQATARLGHEVSLYVGDGAGELPFVTLRPIAALAELQSQSHLPAGHPGWFDAVCAWNEPDMLRGIAPGTVRLVNQQLNDFAYCREGFDRFVDVYTSPSAHHMEFMKGSTASTGWKWHVLPNGCNPDLYSDHDRVPGRVIWASSADRGLHLLLQCWPEIKARVPHASLRCYYNFAYGELENFERGHEIGILEIAQRVRYIRYAIERLKALDVVHVGSVSRDAMVKAWNEAQVLAYPCETIRFTEGFSVTSLEACAAGVLPVLSSVDALGHIYGKFGAQAPMVEAPASAHLPEFIDLVVRGLTDDAWRSEVTERTRRFAHNFTWQRVATILTQIITEAQGRLGIAAE